MNKVFSGLNTYRYTIAIAIHLTPMAKHTIETLCITKYLARLKAPKFFIHSFNEYFGGRHDNLVKRNVKIYLKNNYNYNVQNFHR